MTVTSPAGAAILRSGHELGLATAGRPRARAGSRPGCYPPRHGATGRDVELLRLARDRGFRHREAAMRALRYRRKGGAADLVAVLDDPHPCGMVEVLARLMLVTPGCTARDRRAANAAIRAGRPRRRLFSRRAG